MLGCSFLPEETISTWCPDRVGRPGRDSMSLVAWKASGVDGTARQQAMPGVGRGSCTELDTLGRVDSANIGPRVA